jgi:hypothetical protein
MWRGFKATHLDASICRFGLEVIPNDLLFAASAKNNNTKVTFGSDKNDITTGTAYLCSYKWSKVK